MPTAGLQSLASLVLVGLASALDGDGAPLRCGECMVIQEAIHRSIVHNITAMEASHQAGTTTTATIEIGQIIWRLCSSDAWKNARYQSSYTSACKRFVKKHVDLATNYWKEKAAEEYRDPTLALRMKRAVCPNPDVEACALDELPSDYVPLRADECGICKALVSDVYGMVHSSRERPTQGKTSDAFYRLAQQLGNVCTDLPMRHALRADEREAVHELCEDVWDDHEGALTRLALRRDEEYARALCADELEICDEPMSRAELLASDPTSLAEPAAAHDEL